MGILDTIKRVIRLPTTTPKQYKNIQKSPEQRASEARQIPSIKQSYPEQTNTPYSQAKGGGKVSRGSRSSGSSTTTPVQQRSADVIPVYTKDVVPIENTSQNTLANQIKPEEGKQKIESYYSAYKGEPIIDLTARNQLSWGERISLAKEQFNMFDVGAGLGLNALFSYKTWDKTPQYTKTIPQDVTIGGEFKIDTQQQYDIGKILTSQIVETIDTSPTTQEFKMVQLSPEAYGSYQADKSSKDVIGTYQPKLEEYAKGQQEKINLGKVSFEDATKDLATYQTGLETEMSGVLEKDYQERLSSGSLAFSNINRYKPVTEKDWGGIISTGALVGASWISPVIATGISASFAGVGVSKMTRGFAGSGLPIITRIEDIAVGGLMAGAGVTGFKYGVVEPLRKSITMAEIKGAFESTPKFYTGDVKLGDAGKVDTTYYGFAKYGGAERITKFDVTSIPIKGTDLYGARGIVTNYVEAFEYGTANPILAGTGSKVYGLGYTTPIPGGEVFPSLVYGKTFPEWEFMYKSGTVELSNVYKANIKLYTSSIPKESLVGGLSQQSEKNIFQVSGNVNNILMTDKFTKYSFKPEDFVKLKLKEAPKEFIKGGLSSEQFSTKITSSLIERPSFVHNELLQPEFTLIETATRTRPSFIFQQPKVTNDYNRLINVQKISPTLSNVQINRMAYTPIMNMSSVNRLNIANIQGVSLAQQQLQVPGLKPVLAQPLINPPITTTGFKLPNLGLFPFFPSLPQIGWGEGLGKGFKVGRKFKYSPNIGSVLVGFKMPKMTGKIKFAEMSGFLPRPMIGRTSGSKKKK